MNGCLIFHLFTCMNNVKVIDGVVSEIGENHCEKEKWHGILPEEEDLISRLHRLLGDR